MRIFADLTPPLSFVYSYLPRQAVEGVPYFKTCECHSQTTVSMPFVSSRPGMQLEIVHSCPEQ